MHVILALVVAIASPASPAKKPFTAQDLVRLERVAKPRVSPDGKRVVYELRETDWDANKGVHSVWLLELESKETRRLSKPGVESASPRFSNDGNSIYFLSPKDDVQQVFKMPVTGGEPQAVTSLPFDVNAFAVTPGKERLVVALEVYPDCPTLACTKQRLEAKKATKTTGQLYDAMFVRHWDTWANGMRSHAYLVTPGAAGEPVRLSRGIDGDVPTKPFGDDEEWSFSPDGKTFYFTARIAGRTEPWSTNLDVYKVTMEGTSKPVNLTSGNLATDTSPVVSPDGKQIVWRSMKRAGFEADRYAVMISSTSGGPARDLNGGWDRSADSVAWSPDGKTLFVTADDVGQKRIFTMDTAGGAVKGLTDMGYVSGVAVGSSSVIAVIDDLRSPGQLYRVSLQGQREQLTHHNDERMESVALGEFEQFSFEGWNGEMVYGHVVKPAGFVAGQTYPAVMLIHGGPQGSFGNHWHYRWNPQTYAAAGFVAVAIDFHGSTGYGQAFTDSISHDWGGKPLEDLQKGWAHAVKTYKFLDATRACALGASYGGFMVNWIAGKWQDPWKCLVNHDGIFDSRSMAYSTEEQWFEEWEHGGKYYEHPESYEQFNPAQYVGKWKVPMLVVHGGNDFRVPLEQGLSTFTALQSRGVPSQLLYFPNENHWVMKPQNSVQWHETVESWLKRWTKR